MIEPAYPIDLFSINSTCWRCIPTNGIVKAGGMAVMGAGVAKVAAEHYHVLPAVLGAWLKSRGNHVGILSASHRILSFPTKNDWRDKSDLDLIVRSAQELMEFTKFTSKDIYLPRPGCANGGLKWEDVRKVLAPILSDQIVVITNDFL